jgi:hypothetical protein
MRFARGDARDHIVSHKNDHSVAKSRRSAMFDGQPFVREKMFSTHFLFAHPSATYHSAAAGRSPGAEGEFALT